MVAAVAAGHVITDWDRDRPDGLVLNDLKDEGEKEEDRSTKTTVSLDSDSPANVPDLVYEDSSHRDELLRLRAEGRPEDQDVIARLKKEVMELQSVKLLQNVI